MSHSATATLIVNALPPDFNLTVSPASQVVTQGNSTTYTVTVTPSNGFNGVVTFGASGLPTGASASFNPASVTGSGSSVMTVTTSPATPAAPATLTVTGTSGSLQHSGQVTLNVWASGADFALAASPPAATVVRGDEVYYTVTVTPVSGFYGTVGFGVSGLPSGATASFSPPTVNGSGTTEMRVTAGGSTPLGSYPLTITGTSGTLSHTVQVALQVSSCYPDFALSATLSATVVRGATARYCVVVMSSCGFAGDVALSVSGLPAGTTASFAPPVVSLDGYGGEYSTMTIVTSGSTPAGTYGLTVTGTSQTQGQRTTNDPQMIVVAPTNKFTLSASPVTRTLPIVYGGAQTTYDVTVTPGGGFNGVVSFSLAGMNVTFNPPTVTRSGTTTMTINSGAPVGTYVLSVMGTSGSYYNFTNVELVMRAAVRTLSGKVTESDGVTPIAGATVDVYRSTLVGSATSDSSGSYSVSNLPESSGFAVFCSAAGHKTGIQSPVQLPEDGATILDFALPVSSAAGPTVRDYIYAGGRLLAIAEGAQDGVDFEQFTGANDGSVPLPPLTVGVVTFSGGQVYPTVSFLPAGDPPLYGTYDPVLSPDGQSCWGCQGTITVDFAQPVSNVSFLLLNGGRSTDFTVQDDKGDQEAVTLPGNLESGAATIGLPSSGIRQITITSALGSSEWDFWIDNFRFTVDGAGGSGMAPGGGRRTVTTVHGTPAKPSESGPAATAGRNKSR